MKLDVVKCFDRVDHNLLLANLTNLLGKENQTISELGNTLQVGHGYGYAPYPSVWSTLGQDWIARVVGSRH